MNFSELMNNILGAEWVANLVQIVLGVFSLYLSNKLAKLKSTTDEFEKEVKDIVGKVSNVYQQNATVINALTKLGEIVATGFLDSRGVTAQSKAVIGNILTQLKEAGVDITHIKNTVENALSDGKLTVEEVNTIKDEILEFAKESTQSAKDIVQQSQDIYNEILKHEQQI